MASKASKDLTRILISLIFLVNGAQVSYAVLGSFLDSLSLQSILTIPAACGIAMLLIGILGFFKGKVKICRILGIIVCVLNAAAFIQALLGLTFDASSLTMALLSWIYFDCT